MIFNFFRSSVTSSICQTRTDVAKPETRKLTNRPKKASTYSIHLFAIFFLLSILTSFCIFSSFLPSLFYFSFLFALSRPLPDSSIV
jgi:hypothetical protein